MGGFEPTTWTPTGLLRRMSLTRDGATDDEDFASKEKEATKRERSQQKTGVKNVEADDFDE